MLKKIAASAIRFQTMTAQLLGWVNGDTSLFIKPGNFHSVLSKFLVSDEEVMCYFIRRIKKLAPGKKHVIAVSGGVDSALVLVLMCQAYGAENVMAVHRTIKSDEKHLKDFLELTEALGCKRRVFPLDDQYDDFIALNRLQADEYGEKFYEEGENPEWNEAYASYKSRATTPIMGFIAKSFGGPMARIFGTGNGEEDGAFRYYDKFGDGAVDLSPILGLLKCEVRRFTLYYSRILQIPVLERIAYKVPSADLRGIGDEHNDESELTALARSMGFDIEISYGDCESPGNSGWAVNYDMISGQIFGRDMNGVYRYKLNRDQLIEIHNLTPEEADLILFMRKMEEQTRHKDFGIPGITRSELVQDGILQLAA